MILGPTSDHLTHRRINTKPFRHLYVHTPTHEIEITVQTA